MTQFQTALITGASGGIGLDLAHLFAEKKINLILVARSEPQLRKLSIDLSSKYGVQIEVIAHDLSTPMSPQELFDIIAKKQLRVDYLVNNAGFGLVGNFSELDYQKQIEMVQLNVTTLTALSRLFLPQMLQRKFGRILNVASTAGFVPGPMMAVYYATKAYVVSFSEALRVEVQDRGVTVTTLCPGATHTGFQNSAGMQNSNLFKTGTVMTSKSVAQKGFNGMMKGKRAVIPGFTNKLVAWSSGWTPTRMLSFIAKKLNATGSH